MGGRLSRIFSVRINLDDMFSRLDVLNAGEEAEWLRGFRTGARGGLLRPGSGAALACGHEFGSQAYVLASEFSEKQAAKGRLRNMGDYNRHQPDSSHGSATAQPSPSHGSAISSNPVIQLTSNPMNERTNAPAYSDESNTFDAAPVHSIAGEDRWRYERMTEYACLLLTVGAKIGPKNWPAWKALTVEFTAVKVSAAAKALPADERWPDRTEMALRAQGSQTPIGEAVKHKIRKITQ